MPRGGTVVINISIKELRSISPLHSTKHGNLQDHPPFITIDPEEDFAGQLLRLNLKFDSFDQRGKKLRRNHSW
jgi:hypothetical protein